jgi:sugar/nucleoside kinase (ribokinase family)
MSGKEGKGPETPSLAAILCERGRSADEVLEQAVAALKAEGRRVIGYLQRPDASSETCCASVRLESVASGETFLVTQPLGAESHGCRLDSAALAACLPQLLEEIKTGADLVITNRFGIGEAEGQGLRSALEVAFMAGIPVLTVLRPAYAAQWQDFGCEFSIMLPSDLDIVLGWAEAAMAARESKPHAEAV